MKRTFAAAVIAGAGALMTWACTLLDRPSDYFDPTDTLVTLAIVPGIGPLTGVRELVLTRNAIFCATPTNVYRIDKTGGALVAIATASAADVAAIASDTSARVAWCTQSTGITIWDDNAQAVVDQIALAPNQTCETLAISSDAYAYTAADQDASIRRVFVVTPDGGADAGYTLLDGSAVSPLAFADDDTYFVAQRTVLSRELLASDGVSPREGEPLCFLGAGVGQAGELLIANEAGVAFYLGSTEGRFTAALGPCCGGDGGCPIGIMHAAAFSVPLLRTAIHGADIWHVGSSNGTSELVRSPLAQVIDSGSGAGVAVRGDLGNVSNLAVDDDFAFFLVGDRLQRVSITP